MFANVYGTLHSVAAIEAIVGDRIYRDTLPQGVRADVYIIWSSIGGNPTPYLADTTELDNGHYNTTMYSRSQTEVTDLAELVRNTLEQGAYMLSSPVSYYDWEAKLYVVSIDWSIWTAR